MIKLGYIEPYRKEKTLIPIFQLTELGITTLQPRTCIIHLLIDHNFDTYLG